MEDLKSNSYSHLTAKERKAISFPARLLLSKGALAGEILDFGCGMGTDIKELKEKGIAIEGYDKYYLPNYPQKKFDTILCFYVLNVLLREEQAEVLMEISRLLKPGGKAYFAVRRDIQYEGFRIHKIHQKPTYQCNVTLPYKSYFRNENCEIYEYQHYNFIQREELSDCPFCQPDKSREIIFETATAYAIFDKFPVSNGHTLVIPKKHVSDYFQLSFREQSACWFILNKAKKNLEQQFKPDGFNIGINVYEAAGQTVPHVHIHLIPRYLGDVDEPKGGVRGVIPRMKNY